MMPFTFLKSIECLQLAFGSKPIYWAHGIGIVVLMIGLDAVPLRGQTTDSELESSQVSGESTQRWRQQVRSAVKRSLPLIEASSQEYLKHRDCFSCHHQAMPLITLAEARTRGWSIDKENFNAQLKRTREHLERGKPGFLKGKGMGGQVDTAGYALWALKVGEQPADELTESVIHYLVVRNQDKPFWRRSGQRPPSEASNFTATFLALQGLLTYRQPATEPKAEKRIENARDWLLKTKPKDTEDLVFASRALHLLIKNYEISDNTAPPETSARPSEDSNPSWPAATIREMQPRLDGFLKKLIDEQQTDGGWRQNAKLTSDAYATGTVLSTLLELERLDADDSRVKGGIEFLLDSQHDDGSWHVVSRSDPFQEYFESGFPHETDQFISISATCWATIALLSQLEKVE